RRSESRWRRRTQTPRAAPGGADDVALAPVKAGAQRGKDLSIGLVAARAQPIVDGLSRLLGAHAAQTVLERAQHGGALGRLGLGGQARLERGLELLPHPWDGTEPGGPGVGHV